MDAYLTYNPNRRETWKGHSNWANVRKAITFTERHEWAGPLRVFAFMTNGTFVEIPASEWSTE
jgi:hypothetical protein